MHRKNNLGVVENTVGCLYLKSSFDLCHDLVHVIGNHICGHRQSFAEDVIGCPTTKVNKIHLTDYSRKT